MGNTEKLGLAIVGGLIAVILVVGLVNRGGADEGDPPIVDGVAAKDTVSDRGELNRSLEDRPIHDTVDLPAGPAGPGGRELGSRDLLDEREKVDPIGGHVISIDQAIADPKTPTKSEVQPVIPVDPAAPNAESTAKDSAAGARTHTVADDETMSSLALRYYGDPNRYGVIVSANPDVDPRRMRKGAVLVIPEAGSDVAADRSGAASKSGSGRGKSPVAASSRRPSFLPSNYVERYASDTKTVSLRSPESGSRGRTYTVKAGDTLAAIAQRELGSARHADALAKANAKLIQNPNTLQVGWVLSIPTVD